MSQVAAVPDPFPPDVVGAFETHVSVRTDDVDALAARAAGYGWRVAHIVLARGRFASQPMLGARTHDTLRAVRRRADDVVGRLRDDGFTVTRVKIEAEPSHAGVPLTDVQALGHGTSRYFEHHVKLVLPADVDEGALVTLVRPHGAHLSRNARRIRADGLVERFVTQRCRGVGDRTAARAARALVHALSAPAIGCGPVAIAGVEREFVVYDDNDALDTGWIEAERRRTPRPGRPFLGGGTAR